jgi:hypothetical protein
MTKIFSKNRFDERITILTDFEQSLEKWLANNPEYISVNEFVNKRSDIDEYFSINKKSKKKKVIQIINSIYENFISLHLRINDGSTLCTNVFKKEILEIEL